MITSILLKDNREGGLFLPHTQGRLFIACNYSVLLVGAWCERGADWAVKALEPLPGLAGGV